MEQNLNVHIGPRAVKYFIDRLVDKELEDLGITSAYGPFIIIISENPGISLKDISTLLSVDKAFTTRMTKKLIDEGYAIDKSDNSHKYMMHLTKKGEETAVVIKKTLDKAWCILLEDLSPDEKETFFNVLIKINKTINDYNEKAKI